MNEALKQYWQAALEEAIYHAPMAAEVADPDFVTFFPPNGRYRIKNTRERLEEFRGQMMGVLRYRVAPKKRSGGLKFRNTEQMLNDFLLEEDFENAANWAVLHEKPIWFGVDSKGQPAPYAKGRRADLDGVKVFVGCTRRGTASNGDMLKHWSVVDLITARPIISEVYSEKRAIALAKAALKLDTVPSQPVSQKQLATIWFHSMGVLDFDDDAWRGHWMGQAA